MKLVLASGSSARAEMLQRAGIAATIDPADVDEAAIKRVCLERGETVEDTALALAEAKAHAVAKRHPAALVLGADQMLECGGRWFDKPGDEDQAADQLRALSGRTHRLVSGAVIISRDRPVWQATSTAKLTVRALSDDFIRTYSEAMGAALLISVGAYQIEGLGAQLFSAIEGDLFTIMGLPLLPLLDFLRREGMLAT